MDAGRLVDLSYPGPFLADGLAELSEEIGAMAEELGISLEDVNEHLRQ